MKVSFEGSFDDIFENVSKLFTGRSEGFLGSLEIGHEKIPSWSTAGTEYKLTSIGKLAVACTCPSFNYDTHNCKHIKRANGRS